MVKARFEIGNQEKHVIEVDWSNVTGVLKVTADANDISSGFALGSKEVKFPIGDKEKHTVDVIAKTGWLSDKIKIFVDGKLEGSA
jgi:hypothetical protein